MPYKADLHTHSSISSDGEISPAALVAMAARAGLRFLAVTDHNRVDAVGDAMAAGEKSGVTVIPGIEIDCDFGDVHLHVLGYGIDYARPEYAALWKDVKAKEMAASDVLMERVEALGIMVDRDAVQRLAGDGPVIAEQIAEVALADERNIANPLLAPFRAGGNRDDNPFVNFYWDICGPGKPAHVAVSSMSLEECVRLISSTGGVPVLAHPGQSLKAKPDCLPEIAALGVQGVEAFSSYHSPEACLHWEKQAEENGLFVTCGSDFHGKTKPAIALGQHGAGERVEKIMETLKHAMA